MALTFLILCYLIWGLLPVYWKQLQHIAPLEVLFHRILWSFLFYGLTMIIIHLFSKNKMTTAFDSLRKDPKIWGKLFLSSFMITGNWFIYIYAVNSNQILQASLAYYISPLISVSVGALVYKETLRLRTRYALGFCALGVFLMMFGQSPTRMAAPNVPWLALSLAISFFIYGFVKKSLTIPAIASSFLESLFFVIPAAYFIFFSSYSTLPSYTAQDWVLFVVGGIATGLPLIFFSYAAQKLPFSSIGFFQYLSPTLQLLTAILIYSEDFSLYKIAAFSCIWIGVGFYVSQLIKLQSSKTL